MRIASLLPAATEILFALGFDQEIVGVTRECDYPPRARTKNVVIHSRLPKHAPPDEIDRLIREYTARGESLYAVDADLLEDLRPDLIITQDLCHVCAGSPEDLATALGRFSHRPEVLTLNPQDLGDVWRDILWIGERTFRSARAEELVEKIGARLGQLDSEVRAIPGRPRVALLEWLHPLYVGGHWVPEMIARAGGVDVLGRSNTPSFRVNEEEIFEAAPEVLLIAPCGYCKNTSRSEFLDLKFSPGWQDIPALRNNRVYTFDANNYVSRPGPRLVTGMEAMAKAIHPGILARPAAEAAFLHVEMDSEGTRSASA